MTLILGCCHANKIDIVIILVSVESIQAKQVEWKRLN